MPATQTLRQRSFDGFYASGDGLPLYYQRRLAGADGSPAGGATQRNTVLCLPGVSRNHRDFLPMVGKLSGSFDWLLTDLRGRGYSARDPNPDNYTPGTYVDDICRLLDHLELDTVDVIGTSLGGILAMLLGTQCPQRIGRVVLNDIGAFVARSAIENIGTYLSQAHRHDNWDSVVDAIKPVYGDFFTGLDEADWQALAQRLYRQQPDGSVVPDYDPALFSDSTATDLDLWPFFDSLRGKPTLVVRGANSGLLTPEILARMVESRPDLQTVTVANRGHAPFLDEPEAVAALQQFLAAA